MNLRVLLLFLCVGLLSSCLNLEARLEVSAEGSCGLALRIEAPKLVDSIASLGSDDRFLPIPLDQGGLSSAVSAAGGSLVAYERRVGLDTVTTTATASFPSLTSLAILLDASGKSFSETAGTRRLLIPIASGRAPNDPDLDRFAEAAFASYRSSITIVLPSPAQNSGIGARIGTSTTYRFEDSTLALARRKEPLTWELLW